MTTSPQISVLIPLALEISKRNAANRAKQGFMHRAGSKPFVFHEASSSQVKGSPIGFLALFKATHWSESKGWINAVAEKNYETMKTMIAESESNPDGPTISEFDAGQVVLGKKSGYVRGYGWSAIPPDSSTLHGAQTKRIKMLESELSETNAKVVKLFEMYEALQRDHNVDSPESGQSRDGSHSLQDEDNPEVL